MVSEKVRASKQNVTSTESYEIPSDLLPYINNSLRYLGQHPFALGRLGMGTTLSIPDVAIWDKKIFLGFTRGPVMTNPQILQSSIQHLRKVMVAVLKQELESERFPAWYERVLEDAVEDELETALFPPDEYDDIPDEYWKILDQY